jgi:hypothetical protein
MKMTKKGARSVTTALDQIASLFQNEHETLGVPQRIATDFAYRCDLLSDRVERMAGLKREALTELDVNKEKGFDPEVIGEEVGGPLEGDGDEAFMKAEFTQQENRELRERVQDGDLGMKTNPEEQTPQAGKQASVNVRLASACGKLLQASSNVSNAIVANNIAKLASAAMQVHLGCQCGSIPAARAERVLAAINHVIPVVANGKDLARLASVVALAYKVVAAKKSEDDEEVPSDDEAKEANGKKGGEIPPQFLENVNKKKDEAKKDDDKKDDDKKDDDKKDDDKKDDDKDDKEAKKASHGFDLFG